MISLDGLSITLAFAAGISFFLYGMHVMSVGLQKAAGSKMKKLLEALTRTKLLGVLVGAGVTGIIQSSTATTVMVVGFVNAGIMNLNQSVGIIMGANIGTTVTSWLIASSEWAKYLNPIFLAPLFVLTGVILVIFVKNQTAKNIGEIFAGFGILLIGMEGMTEAMGPLSTSPILKDMIVMLGSNPILGILAGALVTCIIQSSSASVGILQSLAAVSLMPINSAVFIIMGQNIGTCITAIISSIGTSKNAKSAAYIHLIFNMIGSVIFSVGAIIFFNFINTDIGMETITLTQISIFHTSFNVINTAVLFPFSNQIIKLATFINSRSKTVASENDLVHLDERILKSPGFAIENCFKEIVRMAKITFENLRTAVQCATTRSITDVEAVYTREATINMFARDISQYLVKLCNQELSEGESKDITSFFNIINDIERVGDHSENMAELAEYSVSENLQFSETALAELNDITALTIRCFEHSMNALETNDKEMARLVVTEEDQIDVLEKQLRAGHILRLKNNECSPEIGVVFLDLITNLERISDHALNIAQVVLNERGAIKIHDINKNLKGEI